MIRSTRVIPVLLYDGKGLVKTTRFSDPLYVGDPFNTLRIFSEKEVDELLLLDIVASSEGRGPNYGLVQRCATEAFMPLGYGGGISSMEHVERLAHFGVEKLSFNTAVVDAPSVVSTAAQLLGSQAVVASIDYVGTGEAARVAYSRGRRRVDTTPADAARRAEDLGVGEILLTSVDQEGTRKGFDLETIRRVVSAVSVPVIAHGGADSLGDLSKAAREAGASAVAGGSIFTLRGKFRAVLLSYPREKLLRDTVP